MTEHSDAAKAAYPTLPRTTEAHWDMQRTAYDRGREDGEEMRDAHDSMEFPDSYAVTREALGKKIMDWDPSYPPIARWGLTEAILASGALVDVNEVKCEHGTSLHDLCDWVSNHTGEATS